MLLITWMAISALLLHTLATMLVPQRVWDAISLRKLKRGLVRNAKRQIHLVVALLILIAVTGCGQRHCNRIEGWCVDGNVTEAYAKEIGEALRVIRPPLDGEIEVKNAVFTCSGSTTTRCAGEAYDMA